LIISRIVSYLAQNCKLNLAYLINAFNIQSEMNVNKNMNLLKFSLIALWQAVIILI
jgi:hypothetical protein